MTPAHDVIVLGAELTGAMLAAVLAEGGASVLLLPTPLDDRPRGETTVPFSSMVLQLLGDRHGVDAISDLSHAERVVRNAGGSSGVNRAIGFVSHRAGRPQDPTEVVQFRVPGEHGETHLYRPDVDAHLRRAAAAHGADLGGGGTVEQLSCDAGGVVVRTGGTTHRGRYLVDTSGPDSPLAAWAGVREEPTRLRRASRSLAVHLDGVAPYEHCVEPPGAHRNPVPWSQGTLHHVLDGAWLSVVPFDNHPGATSARCSVNLTLDLDAHPGGGAAPAEEFTAVLAPHAELTRQFAGAAPVGPWTATGRLQYSSRRTVGDRWCLLDAAAGGSDLLFSRGVTQSAETVYGLAGRLLAALADDDLSAQRLAPVELLQQGLADATDALLCGAATAMRSWPLWNAFVRVWLLGSILDTLALQNLHRRYLKHRDPSVLAVLDQPAADGRWVPTHAGYRALLGATLAECGAVECGRRTPEAAAGAVFAQLAAADFVPPIYGFADPGDRYYRLTLARQARALWWLAFSAPPDLKQLVR